MRYSVCSAALRRLKLPTASAYPFSILPVNNLSKSVLAPARPLSPFPFFFENCYLLAALRGNYRYMGVRSLSLAVPILFLETIWGNAFSSERPPSPSAKAPCRPAWQTLSNVEMTFFTIISPRPFLYKAGHLCVLTLCKTQCSFWTTLCCEPLAIAAFPAGFLPSQHRACLA